MIRSRRVSLVRQWLCLPAALLLLTSCDRSPGRLTAGPIGREEINNVMEATRHHPSLAPGSKDAGPPIHVNPYVPVRPTTALAHDDHMHAPAKR